MSFDPVGKFMNLNILLLLTWYLLVFGMICFFVFIFRIVNMPSWRDDHGDRTSEVGYFEDPTGRILDEIFQDQGEQDGDTSAPHVQPGSGINSGLG